MKLIKKFIEIFIKPFLTIYLKKERKWNYKDIQIVVKPNVFHPGFFFSSKFMLTYLSKINLENKKVLELGAGTALLSLFCSKKKAIVTATDINKIAIENINTNCKLNKCDISIIHSNLFENIPIQKFDYILINPPFFKKRPVTEYDFAWYCGAEGEYFVNLFKTIKEYTNSDTVILMVLSDSCDIDFIKEEALKNRLLLYLLEQKNQYIEMSYIFQIKNIN